MQTELEKDNETGSFFAQFTSDEHAEAEAWFNQRQKEQDQDLVQGQNE